MRPGGLKVVSNQSPYHDSDIDSDPLAEADEFLPLKEMPVLSELEMLLISQENPPSQNRSSQYFHGTNYSGKRRNSFERPADN
jgi:hypothetical protein